MSATCSPIRESSAGPDQTGFLRGLIDGMRCGVLTFDTDGRLVHINDLGRKILSIRDAVAPGTPLVETLRMHPQLVTLLLGTFDMSRVPNRAEITLGKRAGGTTIGFTISLVRDKAGEPCGAAMFFKDLTQIEHHEEQARLKDRLMALGHMAANMAHEIRNPLAAIEVTCQLLRRRLGEDQACRDLLSKITTEVRRLNDSVNSSLEYVRPVSLNLTHADLGPMLDEAISVAQGRRGRDGVTVRRSFQTEIPPFLMDRAVLRQVFVNLILNAIEALEGDGTVTVEAEVVDTSHEAGIPYDPAAESVPVDPWQNVDQLVLVRVTDDGPGISEADRDRIFNPFYTTKKQGSGVGLAMAKKIVGSHRGLIGVTSTPGQGAEFQVRLPMVHEIPEV
jgi:signal transduction histidine kinase